MNLFFSQKYINLKSLVKSYSHSESSRINVTRAFKHARREEKRRRKKKSKRLMLLISRERKRKLENSSRS